jgi:hypothetical protein
MLPLSTVEFVPQKQLTAQDTFSYANVQVMPVGNVPIVPLALGGALGALIVNSANKAEAEQFAELHVKPVQDALGSFDLAGLTDSTLRSSLAARPSTFGSFSVAAARPSNGQRAGHMVLETGYALTPDFSALQVTIRMELYSAGQDDAKPTYRNTYVYQSPRFVLAPKTTDDIAAMVDMENTRYAALDVDGRIRKANALGQSTEAAHLRTSIVRDQNNHRLRLLSARATAWDPDASATRLAQVWAADDAQAVKAALSASGPELVHMLEIDLTTSPVADSGASTEREVFKDENRKISYRPDGSMISLALSDADLSSFRSAHQVVVPVTASPR